MSRKTPTSTSPPAKPTRARPPKPITTSDPVPAGPEPRSDAQQAVNQRIAHQANVLRQGVFPALVAGALGYDKTFEPAAYQLYLEQMLDEAGHPTDPIERMLLEQLCLAHFRIAQLHSRAGQVEGLEAIKLYTTAAARLLGEFRRTALALRVYQGHHHGNAAPTQPKIYKMAQ